MTTPSAPSQEFYDNNRARFDAETTITEGDPPKCKHYFKRVSSTDVYCSKCNAGWIDMGKWNIEKGKILQS